MTDRRLTTVLAVTAFAALLVAAKCEPRPQDACRVDPTLPWCRPSPSPSPSPAASPTPEPSPSAPPTAEPSPSPSPSPSPTPEPSPSPSPSPSASPAVGCGDTSHQDDHGQCQLVQQGARGRFSAAIASAIASVVDAHPECVDTHDTARGCADCWRVVDAACYHREVVAALERQGLCAWFDGEEIAVKADPGYSEQHDVDRFDGYISRLYTAHCAPGVFTWEPSPQPSPSAPPPPAAACPAWTSVGVADMGEATTRPSEPKARRMDATPHFGHGRGGKGQPCNHEHAEACGGRLCEDPRGVRWEAQPASALRSVYHPGPDIGFGAQVAVGGRVRACPPQSPVAADTGEALRVEGDGCSAWVEVK